MLNTLRPPPEVVASFPAPNYVDPETHGPGLIVIACLLSSVAVLVVGARLYARFCITKAPGIDDALIVLALIFGVTLSAMVILGNLRYYNGYHVWDIPPGHTVPHRINVWIAQLCYTIACAAVKISILLFYRRLSVSFTRTFLIAVWVGIAYNIIYCLGFILTLCLIFRPLQAYWLSFEPVYYATANWTAGSEQIATPLSGVFSVIGDAYSTILPLLLVSGLSMPSRQKLALYGLFSLGFFVVIFGILRTYYMYTMINKDWDFTWTLWKVWVWGEFEMWFSVYAACAPALKPFFRKFAERVSSSRGETRDPRAVYMVRADGQGNLGKVERVWVNKNRHSVVPENGPYVELETERKPAKQDQVLVSSNHIVKQVEYDVEALPAWSERWGRTSSAISTVSGPAGGKLN